MLSNMTSVAALGNRNMTECLEATFEGPAFHPEREWNLSYIPSCSMLTSAKSNVRSQLSLH